MSREVVGRSLSLLMDAGGLLSKLDETSYGVTVSYSALHRFFICFISHVHMLSYKRVQHMTTHTTTAERRAEKQCRRRGAIP